MLAGTTAEGVSQSYKIRHGTYFGVMKQQSGVRTLVRGEGRCVRSCRRVRVFLEVAKGGATAGLKKS